MTGASMSGRALGATLRRSPRSVVPNQSRPLTGRTGSIWPSVTMLVILIAAGGGRFALVMERSFQVYPVASAAAVALFSAYAVPFLFLLHMIDYLQHAPAVLKGTAFAWGGLVATSAAIAGGTALQNILAKTVSPDFAARWGPAVGAAGLEESLKVIGVLAIALVARPRISSVMTGFVYGALVGLGFQVVEDIVFAVNQVALAGGADQVGPVIVTLVLRGFIGGLWSHTLFTALAGAGVAYALVRRDRSRLVRTMVAGGLFLAAWGCHFLWNSPLLAGGVGAGPIGAVVALLIKGIPALVVAVLLVAAAERREADYYVALFAGLGDFTVASRAEVAALVSPRHRYAARRQARRRIGLPGVRAVRRLQHAQARLAVALARDPSREPPADIAYRRREVIVRRHQLVALELAGCRRMSRVTVVALAVGEVAGLSLLVIGIAIAVRMLG